MQRTRRSAIRVTSDSIAGINEEGSDDMAEHRVRKKRKGLYHWLGMLTSLKSLQDAGEMDAAMTLAQLTDPAMLERVNGFLSENPNLLETDEYITPHGLLGRNLYKEKHLIPIKAAEITTIAALYGYKAKIEKTEE